jgi:hypothetical protein
MLPCLARADEKITQEELLRRTRELLDAVAASNSAPWEKYYADDSMYFDEKGRAMNKPDLIKDITGVPKGYVLKFTIEDPWSRIFDTTAIFSYKVVEDLKIYGQQMGANFHMTDTWIKRNGEWQIVATQAFRYVGDPAVGKADVSNFSDYAGTYELAPGLRVTVSVEGDALYYQRGDQPKEILYPEVPGLFFRKGVEGRILFGRDANGKVDVLISRRNHEDLIYKKVS